ncbi:nuclear transport factor 2 family protein [Leptobacterium flavescens]|uniref:Nuclear transport factor 2 family protein n=1 Tax=Leptobacterium flavescens TaxID=472055 RepID=A0A6P0UFN0_9FLAO|nr:nuclear transport factor 2 family protein [Leptobacterium flavescens]NER11827.1 nuclear transport factor 2 family protein [Leptobacterium flavescens]
MKLTVLTIFFLIGFTVSGQSEKEQITETLNTYIEGFTKGKSELLKEAFYPDSNLHFTDTRNGGDKLRVITGKNFIKNARPREGATARITQIDYDTNAAMARIEIVIPNQVTYTDFLLLLKYEGSWKIIQKAFTAKRNP